MPRYLLVLAIGALLGGAVDRFITTPTKPAAAKQPSDADFLKAHQHDRALITTPCKTAADGTIKC